MSMRKYWIHRKRNIRETFEDTPKNSVYVCHRVRSCDFDVTFLELGIIIDNVVM